MFFHSFFHKIYFCFLIGFLHIFLSACAGELTRTAFTVELENLPEEHKNIKLVFFADLHLRKEIFSQKIFEELVEKVNKENAHFILIGGDLVDRTVKDYMGDYTDEIVNYLKRFHKQHALIVIGGNHENVAGKEILAEALEKNSFIFLDDEFYFPLIGNKKLCFYGKNDPKAPKREKGKKYIPPKWEFYHQPTEKFLKRKEYVPENAPLILLSHRPESFDYLPEKENIFQLSAHYHGGMVDLPFLPAGQLLSWYQQRKYPKRPALEYVYGKYPCGRKLLYVTSGISGGDHSALRINVPREYVVITLAGKSKKNGK